MIDRDFPFQVEEWSADDSKLLRTHALCGSVTYAQRVYEALLAEMTGRECLIKVRNGARIVVRSDRKY